MNHRSRSNSLVIVNTNCQEKKKKKNLCRHAGECVCLCVCMCVHSNLNTPIYLQVNMEWTWSDDYEKSVYTRCLHDVYMKTKKINKKDQMPLKKEQHMFLHSMPYIRRGRLLEKIKDTQDDGECAMHKTNPVHLMRIAKWAANVKGFIEFHFEFWAKVWTCQSLDLPSFGCLKFKLWTGGRLAKCLQWFE